MAFCIYELNTKKKEGCEAPPSSKSISRLPACQFALPETIGALWGRTPMHGKLYRGHARYACRRTPRQTSGLPAGAEPSFESKDIIASTNPECPDTFEYNRTTQLHSYTVIQLQSDMATHREEYGDHFAVQTVGAITPGEPALKSVCRTSDHTFQLEQSNERDPECKKVCQKLLAPEKSHP